VKSGWRCCDSRLRAEASGALAQSFCLSHSSRANFEVHVAITRSHPLPLVTGHHCWSDCGRRARLQISPPGSRVSLQKGVARLSFTARSFLTRPHPRADTFHPPYPPIAWQSISRDVPVALARAFNSLNLYLGSGQGCPLLRASNDIHAPSKRARYLSRDGG